jgi:hypothetical protein
MHEQIFEIKQNCGHISVKAHTSAKSMDYSAELRAGWSGIRVPVGAGNFSLHHRVQTGTGAHPASYPMGTGGSFLDGKVAGAWSYTSTPPKRLHGMVVG